MMETFHNFETPEKLIWFLTERLIPDLRDSGQGSIADDFEDCVSHIQRLQQVDS